VGGFFDENKDQKSHLTVSLKEPNMVFYVANPLAFPVFPFSLWDLLKSIAVAWDFNWLLLS
jgi:hypothetical protein